MKAKAMITMLVSVAMILTIPLVALGAPGGVQGPPGGGGGAGDAAGLLYGDLYVIERDGAGVPITRPVTYVDSETEQPVEVQCQQPLAENCALLPLWGECGLSTLPECETYDPAYDPCAVYSTDDFPDYANQLQTVSFGRESVSRSPASVIDKSYAEALKAINLAAPQCGVNPDEGPAIKLDPAGRITLCIPQEDTDAYAWKTIDAPLENLGLYRAVMTDNCFQPIDEVVVGEEGGSVIVTTELSDTAKGYLTDSGLGHLRCDASTSDPKADMLSAAFFIAAGADKFSPVTLDEIINVNTYLGVNEYEYSGSGKNRTLKVTYFDFADSEGPEGWFSYKRGTDACVSATPAALLKATNGTFSIEPALDVFGNVNGGGPGVDLRGGNGVAITVCRGGFKSSEVCDDPTTNTFYGPTLDDIGCGGANWFAQAAEDARKTIWYLHNYEAPAPAY